MRVFSFIVAMMLATSTNAACVNSLERQAPDSRFQINDATVTDTHSGLMWLRCPVGQKLNGDKCSIDTGQSATFAWGQALQVAMDASVAGFNDWRLPNKHELSSIVDRSCSGPAVNEKAFPGAMVRGYWSSTPQRREEGYAWHVDFTTGIMLPRENSAIFGVLLVRNP